MKRNPSDKTRPSQGHLRTPEEWMQMLDNTKLSDLTHLRDYFRDSLLPSLNKNDERYILANEYYQAVQGLIALRKSRDEARTDAEKANADRLEMEYKNAYLQ